MLVIYPVASYYATDEPCRFAFPPLGVDFTLGTRQAAFYGFVSKPAAVGAAWLPAVFRFATDGRCEPLADYGNAPGLVVAGIIVQVPAAAYAPLRAEGSHSLSYVTTAGRRRRRRRLGAESLRARAPVAVAPSRCSCTRSR